MVAQVLPPVATGQLDVSVEQKKASCKGVLKAG
jgi:hypothetical protein